MSLNNLGLGFVFTARDMASGTIRQVGQGFNALDRNAMHASQSYARNFQVMGAGLAVMGAGAATLAGAFAMAGEASHFEMELARVGAIARATAPQLQELHDAAIAAGIATQFTPTQAVEGLGVLAQQGFNTAQSIALLQPTLDLAAGGMISVEQAAESVTNATHVFNLSMEDSVNVAGQLLRISNLTALAGGELGLAMGTVARGSRLTHQSLEEMLPSIGLLRNTGVDASVAAQSVSSALTFMAGRADAIHQSLGVDVVQTLEDGTQVFRPFMDIAMDAGRALEERFANPAERTAMAVHLFSRFGVGAVTGVFDSLQRGVTDSQGVLHRGADAVTYLRNSLHEAGNAAEEFRERMLSTFQGQQILLRGSLETLKIAIGEGFTRALQPIITGAIVVVNRLIEFIQGIPVEIRGAIGQAVIVFGMVTSAMGAFVAAGAAIAIIAPLLEGIAVATGGLLLAMAPLVLAFGALASVGYAFYTVARDNERVAGTLRRSWDAVRLTLQGLHQAFSEGAFSGAVMEELGRAENQGIRRFVLQIAAFGFRIRQFFEGFIEEWHRATTRIAPSIERMLEAFNGLGRALGLVATEGTSAVNGIPSEEFALRGARMADTVASIVQSVAEGITRATVFVKQFVEGFQSQWSTIAPSIDHASQSLDRLFGNFGMHTSEGGKNASSFGAMVGEAFAKIVGGAADVVGVFADIANAIKDAFGPVLDAVHWLQQLNGGPMTEAERNALPAANPLEGLWNAAGSVSNAITPALEQERARERAGGMTREDFERQMGPSNPISALWQLAGSVAGGMHQTPAVAEAQSRTEDRDASARAAAAAVEARRVADLAARTAPQPPVVVQLQVDGETIATATANAQRREQAASFGQPAQGAER